MVDGWGYRVDFRLLGAIEVGERERRLELGHAKQRCVLAVLLIEAGRVVPVPTLIERVWGNEPPDGALSVIYGYIARLRRLLAPAGVRLPRGSGGYVLEVDPERVDLHRFRRLAVRAGAANPVDAAGAAEAALVLWRGAPFGDVTSPWLAEVAEGLAQQRLTLLVKRNDAYLCHGRHAELVDNLRESTAAHPLDERLAGQLMLALYRCGRPADALEAFRAARARLADLSGIEPGPHLRRLHQGILRGDPDLVEVRAPTGRADQGTSDQGTSDQGTSDQATSDPGRAGQGGTRRGPAGLPLDVAGFVGRHAELARLDRLVDGDGMRRTAVISAVRGTAGVGKTALAVHWAHRVKDRFPDGSLYADLRGYGPGAQADPDHVLEGMLTVLGVAPERIPSDVDAKAVLYRSLLDGRRLLVVLDNAANPQQVRPLLPGSPTCAVVVTSRSTLSGLVARERAETIDLDVLPLEEAVALLAGFVGHDRVAAEQHAARSLALLCARLPVALCVAGELAASRPDDKLGTLVADLDPAGTRLDILDAGGDADTAVRAVFSWSFDNLHEEAARLFRLLGLFPGQEVDGHAAAALTGSEPSHATRLLDTLARAHLVQRAAAGRYRMHDLLRTYAAECATEQDSPPERTAALERLVDFYLCAAATAMDTVFPPDRYRRPQIVMRPDVTVPALAEAGPAQSWLDAERANIVAAAECAARHGWPDRTAKLAATVRRYLLICSHWTEATELHTTALRAAHDSGDRAAEATALLCLGQVHQAVDRFDDAVRWFDDALQVFAATGDRMGQARALFQLGTVLSARARYEAADDHLTRSIAIFREHGDRMGEANALCALGEVLTRCGRYVEARDHLLRSLEIFEEMGHTPGYLLGALGDAYFGWGRYDPAKGYYDRALVVFVQTGDRRMEARTVIGLAAVTRMSGRCGEAERGYRYGLRLAREVDAREEEARALDGIGHTLWASGQRREARRHWQHALAIFEEYGFGEAEAVRRQLATVNAER